MSNQGSFSDFYGHMCQTLKQKGGVEEISGDFSKLTSDSERFNFVSKLMSKYEFRLSCLDEEVLSKCPNESVRLRNEGNDAFIKGKESKALNLYSRSALLAPTDAELSMAYANRSAVLAAQKYFKESIADVERAIELNYPDHLKFKLIKRKGECLCQLRNHSDAQKSYNDSLSLLKNASNLPENKQQEVELKLLASLKECCSHSDIQRPDEVAMISMPTFTANEEVPCASESIKISFVESLGRHIVATRSIDPGEVIAIEEPFASILLPEYFLSHCYHCLRRCWALMPCRKCCHVMFCSEDCRRMSWRLYHEKECSILSFILKLDMGKMAHLALRIVLLLEFSSLKNMINTINLNPNSKCLREKGFTENGKYISSHYTPMYHLEGHSDRRYISDLFKRACMSYCIVSCLKNGTTLFSSGDNSSEVEMVVGELILRHLQNLPCNAHEVSELLVEKQKSPNAACLDRPDPELASSLIEIGGAAYAMLSLINHSCDPNVVRHSYNGSTAVLRAIRPIKEGEQLLDNYGYHYAVHSVKVRKDNLREQYFFECMCTPCSELWPTYQLMQVTNIDKSLRCPYCTMGPLEKTNLEKNSVVQKSEFFLCKKCKKSVDVTLSKENLACSSEDFKMVLHDVLTGQKVDTMKLLSHLLLMDKILVRPWKEYNDCQEAIKHIFALEGNCFKI